MKWHKKKLPQRRVNKLNTLDFEKIQELYNNVLLAQEQFEYDLTTEGILAREINKTPLTSFERYGDKNKLTKSIRVRYLSDDGMPLDVQAFWLTENYNKEVTPSEIADFMMQYENGVQDYETFANIEACKQEWKQYTGFNYDSLFIKYYMKLKANENYVPEEVTDGDIF